MSRKTSMQVGFTKSNPIHRKANLCEAFTINCTYIDVSFIFTHFDLQEASIDKDYFVTTALIVANRIHCSTVRTR